MTDIAQFPAARDLLAWMGSEILGGKSSGVSPLWKSAKIFNSVFLFGVSRGLACQFY